MDYQYKATVYNYETGIAHRGVFRTSQEADAFLTATEGQQKSCDAELGNAPYETYEFTFDPVEALKAYEAWLGDHQITGRD